MRRPTGFKDVSRDWGWITECGLARKEQKDPYKSTNSQTKDGLEHIYGLAGEQVVSLFTGWPVDKTLRAKGDGGIDFWVNGISVDAKTTTHWRDGKLLAFIEEELRADIYMLVELDVSRKQGRVVGWCSKEELCDAKHRDIGPDKDGKPRIRRCINKVWFFKNNQLGLPTEEEMEEKCHTE